MAGMRCLTPLRFWRMSESLALAPEILRCYDPELFLQVIQEAKEHSDFCIAFVHWGTEYSYELEQVQLDTGKIYLDAGADAVIGTHSHCLQGWNTMTENQSYTVLEITGSTKRHWILCFCSFVSREMMMRQN